MLKHEVYSDIEKCGLILDSKDTEKAKKYVSIIAASYGDYIAGINDGLDFNRQHYSDSIDYLGDLEILKRKLELFRSNACIPTKNYGSKFEINNNNDNNNINTNNINIQLEFKEIREMIQNNGSLSEEEINEVLLKIDEIEEVNKSEEPINKKWFKLKSIMVWTATKGIVIAAPILNLITAVLKYKK